MPPFQIFMQCFIGSRGKKNEAIFKEFFSGITSLMINAQLSGASRNPQDRLSHTC